MDSESQLWHRWSGSRPISRRQALGGAASTAGSMAFLAACGKSRGSRPQTASNPGASGKPKYGGQINLARKSDFFDLDPSGKPSANFDAVSLLYDGLLRVKTGPTVDYWSLTLQPSLADRWETPDDQTYTFHLHKGAKFAGSAPMSGRLITSADVKWSMEYLSRTAAFARDKAPKLAPSIIDYTYAGLQSVETPDDSTVVVRFDAPFAPFLNYSAWQWDAVLAHEVYDEDGNFSKRSGGTGPFQYDEAASKRGERWVFKKNPDYFMTGRPYIDQINMLIIKDDAATYAAFQTKQVDKLDAITVAGLGHAQIQKMVPSAVMYSYLNSAKNLSMETDRPPFNDQRVRRALGLCIDRDEFLKVLSEGKGGWAPAASMPSVFSDAEVRQMLRVDPAQSKSLVAAAGSPNGVDAELLYPGMAYGEQHIVEIQLIQKQAKAGNIHIALKSVDKTTESLRQKQGDYQLNLVPKIIVGGDLDGLLYAGYYSTSGANYGHIKDPKLDSMLVAQRQAADQAKRKELIRGAVRYINEEPWSIGLYYGMAYQFWHPYLKNYAPNYATPGLVLTDGWLEK